MTSFRVLTGCAALTLSLMFAASVPARAQAPAAPAAPAAAAVEISPSHLAAALEVVITTRTGGNFDLVLPSLATQVQDQLIRIRPDMHTQITAAVDAMALELVTRRVELNNDIARIWALAFTEAELQAIAEFYRSPPGVKLAEAGAGVLAESVRIAQAWTERVGEELLAKSREELKRQGLDI